MTKYLILIALVSVYETGKMIINKQSKELIVFIFFVVITLSLGYIYVYNIFDASYSELLLRLVKSKYLEGS